MYILAVHAKNNGQDFIPVHVFPVRFGNTRSLDYLGSVSLTDAESQKFWVNLKEAYDYFEKTRRIPVVMVNSQGKYVYTSGSPSNQALAQIKPANSGSGK